MTDMETAQQHNVRPSVCPKIGSSSRPSSAVCLRESWLEAAFNTGAVDYERERICTGTPAQVKRKLEALAAPRKSYGPFPKPYEHFTKLVIGIEVAEEQLPSSGLAVKLFREARKLFEIPDFDVHHVACGSQDKQLWLLRSYIGAFQRYAPTELDKGIGIIIKQHCTDLTFLSGLRESLESVLSQVPPQQVGAFGKIIVAEMIKQKLYISGFALSRLILSEMSDPSRKALVLGRLEDQALLLKSLGTKKQQQTLIKSALAMLRARGEGSLAESVREHLAEIFPEA